MKPARLILALLLFACAGLQAQPLRIASWTLDPPSNSGADPQLSEADRRRLREIANLLKRFDADFIVLPEVRNRGMASQLANFLKPQSYQIAVCSSFRSSDPAMPARQIAILSRLPAFAGWSEEWRGPAQVDAAGGFAFAAFQQGTNSICLFATQWPAAKTADPAAEARRREPAAHYLLHHVRWAEARLTNGPVAFAIAGGLSVAGPTNLLTGLAVLEQAGFHAVTPRNPAATAPVDAFFARQAEFSGGVQSFASRLNERAMLYGDFTVRAPEPAPAPGPEALALARKWAAQAKVFLAAHREELRRWWPAAAGAMVLLLAVRWGRRRWRRRQKGSLRGTSSTMVVDASSAVRVRPEFAFPASTTATSSEPLRDMQVDLWQKRALAAEERAREAAIAARSGLMPQFVEVMKQRLYLWLASQRQYLMASQQIGTKQVLELEQRLGQLQGQFEDRLREGHHRIEELERDVAAKERVIRDLLRAQVKLAGEREEE